MDLISLLAAGAFSGFFAGLFGVGGGIVIVPVLSMLFTSQGVDPAMSIKVGVGTSLAAMVVTSLSSVFSHHKHGAVDWNLVKRILPGIVSGSVVGVLVVDAMPGKLLYDIFILFAYLIALRMFFGQVIGNRPLPGIAGMTGAGFGIGAVSASLGIGGATLSVPFMTYCGVAVKRAVGTAAAIGLPIAVSGTLGFIVSGLQEPGRPPGTLGYVNLPAFGGIVVVSVLFAPLGAWLAHRLPDKLHKRLFALFVIVVATRMLIGRL